MEKNQLKPILEALIYVSEEPITVDVIKMVLEDDAVDKKIIKETLDELIDEINESPLRGIKIVDVAGGFQIRSKSEMSEWVKKLNVPKPVKLSQAAMETLSIIAYRQPILRSEIEEIRGVDSGGVVKTLLEKNLIKIIGKSNEAGNPLVYSTTNTFLEIFGLSNLRELPTLREIEDLEVRDKVGTIGKEEFKVGEIQEGIGAVLEEYKDSVQVYKPDPEKEKEDYVCIKSLENSMKQLKNLEKEMFPKAKEEIKIISKETGEEVESDDQSLSETNQENINNETTPTQDNS